MKLSVKPNRTKGFCLCGSISVELPEKTDDLGVCHCTMCRRWTSGPWMALQVPDARIAGDGLCIYRGSSFAERAFCGACGSHIYHRPVDGPELAVSAGLFDNPDQYVAREIFVDAQPEHYGFTNSGPRDTQWAMALKWLPKLAIRRFKKLF